MKKTKLATDQANFIDLHHFIEIHHTYAILIGLSETELYDKMIEINSC